MPARPRPIRVLSVIFVFGYPVASNIYWRQIVASGILSIDGDSIGIETIGSILAALLFSPIAFGITWLRAPLQPSNQGPGVAE